MAREGGRGEGARESQGKNNICLGGRRRGIFAIFARSFGKKTEEVCNKLARH
jgi:hypothetical protein